MYVVTTDRVSGEIKFWNSDNYDKTAIPTCKSDDWLDTRIAYFELTKGILYEDWLKKRKRLEFILTRNF